MATVSSSTVSRTQSLRKPSTTTTMTATTTSQRNAATGGTHDRTTRITANGAAPTATVPRTSRPLSGVFGRMAAPSARQRDADTSSVLPDAPTTTSRLTRAASIRQLSSASAASSSSRQKDPDVSSVSADAAPSSRLTRAKSIRQISAASARTAPSDHYTSTVSHISAPPASRLTRAASIKQISNASTRTAPSSIPESAATPAGRRPTSSSGLPPSSRPRGASSAASGHTRTKSSGTALTGTTTTSALRPPSQGSATSTSTTSTSTTATTKPPARTASISTPRTTSVRPKSLHLPSTSAQPTSPPKVQKPFTTHNQSFTPLKPPAPKALTSTFLAPPSPSKLPANVAISAETARLQTQLLQLHLLHRASFDTTTAYQDSAKSKLGKKFERVKSLESEVGKLENATLEEQGIRDLLAWAGAGPGLERKVQVLDSTAQTVWALTEPQSGKYGKVVRRFEKWLNRAEVIMDGREVGDIEELELIGKVGGEWEREVEGLERKLGELRDGLRDINGGGVNGEGGSIGRMVKGLKDLVWGMLEE
ncbi:hypothetical protein QBC43DRAFT_315645, partial [Cladorrhinum sp. PSN259]